MEFISGGISCYFQKRYYGITLSAVEYGTAKKIYKNAMNKKYRSITFFGPAKLQNKLATLKVWDKTKLQTRFVTHPV